MIYPTVLSLHGSAVLYLTQGYTIRTGKKQSNGRPLQERVLLRPGTILMPRLIKPEEEGKRPYFLWHIFHYGLHEALRAVTVHIEGGYDGYEKSYGRIGEVRKLEDVRGGLTTVLSWLVRDSKLSPLEREALIEFLADKVENIGRVRDPNKRRALERMVRAASTRDSLGRINVGARMASIVGAGNDLRERLALISFIQPRIGTRAVALAVEMERIRRIFVRTYHGLNGLLMQLDDGMIDASAMTLQIIRMVDELGRIRVGPYPAHVTRIVSDLLGGDQGDLEGRDLLRRAQESLRCKRARWELEDILSRLSAVSDDDAVVRSSHLQPIAEELGRFRPRLRQINDRAFDRPVVTDVDTLLGQAIGLLTLGTPKQAKGLIKRAARKL